MVELVGVFRNAKKQRGKSFFFSTHSIENKREYFMILTLLLFSNQALTLLFYSSFYYKRYALKAFNTNTEFFAIWTCLNLLFECSAVKMKRELNVQYN
ncbi:hypothetical protein BpHYR1_019036 [Brachionus plicatilis]|uniref:Uncharacterized protein n=1 Tax=Brachionus plicatilis TaxID=10195 RepID=A0A3M7PNZ7_BRAPC|nr:hypothetical protein BpHYR1_019036 [Brachionus plicatilis]